MNLPPAARVRALYTRATQWVNTWNYPRDTIFYPVQPFAQCRTFARVQEEGRRRHSPFACPAIFPLLGGGLGRAAAPALGGSAQGAAVAPPFARPLGIQPGLLLGDQIVAPAGLLPQPPQHAAGAGRDQSADDHVLLETL